MPRFVEFTRPAYLLLLPLLGYYTWRVSGRSLAGMSDLRRRLALGLRLVVIFALALALAGARMVSNVSQQCVVFVLDVSDSIPRDQQQAAVRYVNEALRTIGRDQKAGVVVFGREASVELTPSAVSKLDRIYSVPDTSGTDISQALGLALALFPERSAKKVVLISDGNQTSGNAMEQAALAGADNVSIDVVPVSADIEHEVLLERMVGPASVRVGEPFDLKVVTVAKQPTTARIRILRSGSPAGSRVVEVAKGKSVFSFEQSVDEPGGYEFTAIIEPEHDTRPENNAALAFTRVSGKPMVLYVEGVGGQERYLASALRASEMQVDARGPSGIPTSLAQLSGCDMLVISDVPAWSMSPEQMTMIQAAVRDTGIGFTMVGGENGFGAGGYYDTPIEKTLPVDMSLPKTRVLPSLSLVVVMDKSGSMDAPEGSKTRIQLANDAAAAVVRLLQPVDMVGVIVCHDHPVTAVRLTPARNKNAIYRQIATVRAEGGGITVFSSVNAAYEMIRRSPTRQKHVILLADGSDCDEQSGVVPLVRRMAEEKITVTAVAIGDGPDVPFLQAVAAAGKGGFYLAQKARDLKAIFTKDAMTVSRSLVVEEPFVPTVDASDPVVAGIDTGAMPPLLGYIATSPKSAASVVMRSHRNDPILATWQYGLGRSAAFTSDCKARWSARWLTWSDYSRLWAQLLRSTMRRGASSDFQSTVEVADGVGRVTVDAVDESGGFVNFVEFSGSVVTPDLGSRALDIQQTGPGRYEAAFPARDVGSYVVSIARRDRSGAAPEVSVVSVSYPLEYRDLSADERLLRRLAAAAGGVFDPSPADVFAGRFRPVKAHTDLWRLFALIAVLALPLDVAARRVAVSPRQAAEFWAVVRGRFKLRTAARPESPERVETVGALLESRKRRSAGRSTAEPPVLVSSDAPKPARPAAEPEQRPKPDPESSHTSRLLEAKKRARDRPPE